MNWCRSYKGSKWGVQIEPPGKHLFKVLFKHPLLTVYTSVECLYFETLRKFSCLYPPLYFYTWQKLEFLVVMYLGNFMFLHFSGGVKGYMSYS